jgi:hypothetical protein
MNHLFPKCQHTLRVYVFDVQSFRVVMYILQPVDVLSAANHNFLVKPVSTLCVCVCVCEREREREREKVAMNFKYDLYIQIC